jgi:hypothetical protein
LRRMQADTCICAHILRAAFRPTSFKSIPFPTPPIHRSTMQSQRTFGSTKDRLTPSQRAPFESSSSRESAGIQTNSNRLEHADQACHSRTRTAPPRLQLPAFHLKKWRSRPLTRVRDMKLKTIRVGLTRCCGSYTGRAGTRAVKSGEYSHSVPRF